MSRRYPKQRQQAGSKENAPNPFGNKGGDRQKQQEQRNGPGTQRPSGPKPQTPKGGKRDKNG